MNTWFEISASFTAEAQSTPSFGRMFLSAPSCILAVTKCYFGIAATIPSEFAAETLRARSF